MNAGKALIAAGLLVSAALSLAAYFFRRPR